ncbi:MAG: hypothetical protein ACTFAL_14845 [Candidatus Electronema sp. V4]|uniref:hypothetical protein n=1 Tax=Candidatus Electronema sp. V4 TaxID=3454756 RepID=UPI0040557A5D
MAETMNSDVSFYDTEVKLLHKVALFNKDAEMILPVYLEAEIFSFVQRIAERKKMDISSIVNQILRSDMQLAEVIK